MRRNSSPASLPREVEGVPGEAGGGGPRDRGPREACFAGWDVGAVLGEAGGGGREEMKWSSGVAAARAGRSLHRT